VARVLVIGGTGYLGSLICASLLERTNDTVILAARPGRQQDDVVARLRMEMSADGDAVSNALRRLRFARLPAPGDARGFLDLFRDNQVDEVVNSAGAVHYFDVEKLRESNVDLVDDLLTAAKATRVGRFTHVSTAFAQGYGDDVTREGLLPEPDADPTAYTRFKRRAEHAIARSGVPFLVLRPSIVVGDSRDGNYFGPDYGVYQFWQSFARMLMDRYRETIHAIAAETPVHMIHQDAFIELFLAARVHCAGDAFVNAVSPTAPLPTARDLWRLFCDDLARPRELVFHDTIDSAPLRALDPRMRAFLTFTAVNADISTRDWRFETTARDALIAKGARCPAVTLDSIRKCQLRFAAASPTVRAYMQKFEARFPGAPRPAVARLFSLPPGPEAGRWLL
jgi:nucleoside-diphosphate-sugar epimerase